MIIKEKAYKLVIEVYVHDPIAVQTETDAMQCLTEIFASVTDNKLDDGGNFDWKPIGHIVESPAHDPEDYKPGDAFKK